MGKINIQDKGCGKYLGAFLVGKSKFRKTVSAPDKRAALRLLELYRAEKIALLCPNGVEVDRRKVRTLGTLMELDVRRAVDDKGAGERRQADVRKEWATIAAFFGGLDTPVERVTDEGYAAFKHERLKVCSKVTVIKTIDRLRWGIAFARKKGWVGASFELEPLRMGTKEKEIHEQNRGPCAGTLHTDDVLDRWFAALWEIDPDVYDYYRLIFLTALRRGEMDRLVRADIYDAVGLDVKKTIKLDPTRCKTWSKYRVIGLADEALEILARHPTSDPLQPIFGAGRSEGRNTEYRRNKAQKACKAIGYDDIISPRDLRHHWIDKAVRINLVAASHAAGHRHLSTTQRYVHSNEHATTSLALTVQALRRKTKIVDTNSGPARLNR